MISISGPEASVERQEPASALPNEGTNAIVRFALVSKCEPVALVPGASVTWAGLSIQGCVEAL